jgi:DNA-binding NtrC family response regulator
MAGRDFRLPQVSFAHTRASNLREFEHFFGCPVEFGALADQLDYSNETLALPLVTEDRHLLDALQPICDEAAKERHTPKGTLRASVEDEVQKLLPHGKANRRTVARALGMSERTLSRKLAEERTTYDETV